MNNKVFGLKSEYALLKQDTSRIIASYEYEELENGRNATWYEVVFYKTQTARPTLAQIKEAISADINAQVKEKIISGFVWNNLSVWLSEENQMNWAQAKCPTMFKIGEQSDGTPIYQSFETQAEMATFFEACVNYKQQCLSEGWQRKDAIDWSEYERALEEMFPSENNNE